MSASPFKPFRRLPPNPDLRHLKNQARQLLDAHRQEDPEAVLRIQRAQPRMANGSEEESPNTEVGLQQCQHVVATEYGFSDWAALLRTITTGQNTYEQYAELYADVIPLAEENPDQNYASASVEDRRGPSGAPCPGCRMRRGIRGSAAWGPRR